MHALTPAQQRALSVLALATCWCVPSLPASQVVVKRRIGEPGEEAEREEPGVDGADHLL